MKSSVFKIAASVLMSSTIIATSAFAQDADEQVQSVYEKYRPDYNTTGARVGSFLFSPSIGVDGKFNSNIFAQETDEVDDFIAIVKPSLALVSDWNNGYLGLFANADIARYADNTSENYEDINLSAAARIDVAGNSNITFDIGYSDLHEDRGSPDAVGSQIEPTTFSIFSAGVGFVRDEGLVSFAVAADYEKRDFDNVANVGGGTSINDDRDRETYTGSARLGYHLNEEYEAFVKFTTLGVQYDDSRIDGGPLRDSDGWSVVGGTAFNLGGASEGEFYLGYEKRDFDSSSLSDTNIFTYGASLLWGASDLTSVKFSVDRFVDETTVQQGTVFASGTVNSAFALRVEHELQRNLLLNASGSFTKMSFINVTREDDLFKAGAGAKYLMNRNFALTASYDYEKRDSNVANSDYNRHQFLVGLTAQW